MSFIWSSLDRKKKKRINQQRNLHMTSVKKLLRNKKDD